MSEKLSYYEKAMKHPIASTWHKNCIKLVKSLMPNKEGLKHLDVGCGDGVRIRMVKPKGEIVGIDIDDEMLSYAKKRGIITFKESIEKMHFPDNSFDLVTAIEVFEHVEHPVLGFAEIYRVLKPRGFFICVTPNHSLIFSIIWKFWTRFGMGKYWREKHIHEYNLWSHTKSGMSLIDRLRDIGFKPEKTASTNFGMIVGVRSLKV
ncbi:MAG: class I SAM-dependent methyltransferase [Candidatus Bathyarchaeia archaeon]